MSQPTGPVSEDSPDLREADPSLGPRPSRSYSLVSVLMVVVMLLVLGFFAFVLFVTSCPGCGSAKSPTTSLDPTYSAATGFGHCGAYSDTYNASLNPSATATTAIFDVDISNAPGSLAPVDGLASSGLAVAFARCDPVQGGWVGVLWEPSGQLLAYYSSGGTNGWSPAPGLTLPVIVASGAHFEVITSNAGAAQDSFNCIGINGNSVVGQTTL